MTIPTRPAPLPPNSGLRNSGNTGIASAMLANTRKEAPPRPPPPKIKPEVAHKPVGILSNLFGSKNGHKFSDKPKHPSHNQLPLKIPPPPSSSASKPFAHCVSQKNFGAFNIDSPRSDMQLISFDDSPPPQPTIKKSNTGSDCVSIGSFSSTTSSPHIFGATSQAESGFEDDFNVSDFKLTSNTTSRSTTFSSDPFECLDDFEAPKESTIVSSLPNIRNVKPQIQPKPTFESSSFYLSSASSTKVAAENLEAKAGKTLMKPSTNSMPTIIKPAIANKSKALLSEARRSPNVDNARRSDEISDDSFSLPMPTIPPPQLPSMEPDLQEEEGPSYAVVLYDFESDVVEDLNLRVNEKVYLIKQMNDEWMFGRNKRGCEGIFPISYVDIRVPLKVEPDSGTASRSSSVSPAIGIRVRAIYTFNAETSEDLTITENEMINVISQINEEWLYGSNEAGDCGQFPANFLEFIPSNLPQK